MRYWERFYNSRFYKSQKVKSLLEMILIFSIFIMLTIISTWPLLIQSGTHVKDPGDHFFITWVVNSTYDLKEGLEWDTFWDKSIFYPYGNSGAFSDHSLSLTILSLPFLIFRVNEIYLANYMVLSGYILTGVTGYYLFKHYTRKKLPAIAGAVVLTFSTYHLSQMSHLQVLHMEFIPLVILYFEKLIESPKRGNIFLFSLFFVLNAYVSIYHLSFVLIPLLLIFTIRIAVPIIQHRSASKYKSSIVSLAIATCTSAILLIPTLLPYLQVNKDFNVQVNSTDAINFSARPESYLIPAGPNNLLMGDFRDFYISTGLEWGWWETVLYPGILTLIIAATGILAVKKIKSQNYIVLDINPTTLIYILLFVVAVILTFGPFLVPPSESYEGFKLPYYYLSQIPLYKAIRVPARFGSIIAIALALLVSLSMLKLKVKSHIPKLILGVVVITVLFLDTASIPYSYTETNTIDPELRQWVEESDEASVFVFIPIMQSHYKEVEFMRYQRGNPRRTINGYSGYIPELNWDLGSITAPANLGKKQAIEIIHSSAVLGASYLIIDKREYSTEQLSYLIMSGEELGFTNITHVETRDYIIMDLTNETQLYTTENDLAYTTEIVGNEVIITQQNETEEVIVYSKLNRYDISIEYDLFGVTIHDEISSFKPILLTPGKSYNQRYKLNRLLIILGAEVEIKSN